ncbi:unnamed protein product, partial [Gulo gulo]
QLSSPHTPGLEVCLPAPPPTKDCREWEGVCAEPGTAGEWLMGIEMEQNQNPRQEVERKAGPKNRKSSLSLQEKEEEEKTDPRDKNPDRQTHLLHVCDEQEPME